MASVKMFSYFYKNFFMRNKTVITALFLCAHLSVGAQEAKVRQYTAPKAGTATLIDADDKYNAAVFNVEAPDVEHNFDKKQLREIKLQVEKQFPRKESPAKAKKTTAVPAPVMTIGFIADSLSGIPPDNYCAVSNGNKAISVMNSFITVHDATSGNYLTKKGLLSFSSAVGLNNSVGSNTHYRFDPKVVYDPVADRFICVMLNSINQNNWIVIAFSKTNDPTGAWNFYKFYGDYTNDTTWFDYPAISITKDEFFLTGNKIRYNQSWQAGFKQTLIYQIKKADGYNGDTALTYRIWDDINYKGKNIRCLHPLNPGSALAGPEQYFLSNRNFDMSNDSIFLVRIPGGMTAADTALTVKPLISNLPYGVPPDAKQPDTAKTLATNDGRVLGGFIKGNEIQFVSTSSNAANGASSIYHGVISNIHTTPAVHASLISNDTLDFGYPNISYTGDAGGTNQSIISYEFSGRKTFPGYGAVFFDGTDHSDMLVIKTGEKSISMLTDKQQRWGDYSGSQPDWDAPGAVWVEGIFGRKDARYGNYMARLASPYYSNAATQAETSNVSAKVFPVPSLEFVNYEFSVAAEQSFSFVIYDMAGKVVDKVLDAQCKKGRNIIQFNIAPLAPGTYFLQAIGADGTQIPVHKLIRQ